jgi:hypothetical protein
MAPLPERALPEIREQLDALRRLHQEDFRPRVSGKEIQERRYHLHDSHLRTPFGRLQLRPASQIASRGAQLMEISIRPLVPIWCQEFPKFLAFSFIFLPTLARTCIAA